MILTAMLMALPSGLMAQQSIQRMIDNWQGDNRVRMKSQHLLERDTETGRMEAMFDVYDGMMPNDALGKQLVKATQTVFEREKDSAYQIRTISHTGTDYTSLAVGDGYSHSVAIGKIEGSDYIFACFIDKGDPEKKHRYAYAFEWADRGDSIQFRLAVTYALIPKYRNNRSGIITINGKTINMNGISSSFGLDSISFGSERHSELWLSEFNIYKNLFLKRPEGHATSQYVTNIYKLCKKADCLETEEKKLVCKEIQKLRKKTEDEFIQGLFDMSIERLNK